MSRLATWARLGRFIPETVAILDNGKRKSFIFSDQ